jgi:hypothetical protein
MKNRGLSDSMRRSTAARIRSTRSRPSTPNTTRTITSSASDCVVSIIEKRRPGCQRSAASRAASAIVAPHARIAPALNGGVRSLRSRRCRAPELTTSEVVPNMGSAISAA